MSYCIFCREISFKRLIKFRTEMYFTDIILKVCILFHVYKLSFLQKATRHQIRSISLIVFGSNKGKFTKQEQKLYPTVKKKLSKTLSILQRSM